MTIVTITINRVWEKTQRLDFRSRDIGLKNVRTKQAHYEYFNLFQ